VDTRLATARKAGLVYFVFMIIAIIGEFVLPNPVVHGDAAATARNIADAELTYRFGILIGFTTHAIFIVLVVLLYKLFEDVDKHQALLLVLFVTVGVSVALANMLSKFATLSLLGDEASMSVFTPPQLEALALHAQSSRRSAAAFPMLFWGLWLFPFGVLVMRSGFLPPLLGILLLVAGVGYVVTGMTAVLFPEHQRIVSRFMTPLYMGEVPIVFWLLIKGAKRGDGVTAGPPV
jgi:hypothetical protein